MTEQKFYLQPQGFLRGCSASSAGFKRLNGGDLYFSAVRIIERVGKEVTSVLLYSNGIDNFLKSKNNTERNFIETLLENMTSECAPLTLEGGHVLEWDVPIIQGVLNVTPDSFSDGGSFDSVEAAITQAEHMIEAGADIIDIGGESTKPGAISVSVDQELSRVIPVIEKLSSEDVMISIDSRNADIMSSALKAGAQIINDVSALTHDPRALEVVLKSSAPVILMHAQGTPQNMQNNPSYDNAVLDIYDYLESRVHTCIKAGIAKNRLIIDPGIGFGKTLDHNLEILSNISIFHGLGVPLLIGVSRKRFIGELSGEDIPKQRVPGSITAAMSAIEQGVQIIRVHDVSETKQGMAVFNAIHRKHVTF